MDFWSRLIKGGGLPPAKQAIGNNPQQRLARFEQATEHLSQLWRKSKGTSLSTTAAGDTRACLESLRGILLDESRSSAPHLCIEYAVSARIYVAVTELASLPPIGVVARETIGLLNVLVDSEDADFLESRTFADAIMGLAIKLSTSGSLKAETEAILFELLFGIAAKLKLQPDCIDYWFRPDTGRGEQLATGALEKGSSPLQQREFPLFYLLLENVHREGRVGDFARTGLLYVIESAAGAEALERWVVESDLATLMASGLGALYSQLTRKLAFSYTKDAVPAVVSFSEASQSLPSSDAEETTSTDYQTSVNAFLTYLAFWQDLLEHCISADIRQTLLDHFEFLFLQQLLYPSLLESSDIDGGSVAVLTYLKYILESISHADLVHRVLHYLLALRQEAEKKPPSARPAALARRRKSESLISQQAREGEILSPDLFSLVDFILTSLRSTSQQTITATLRLLVKLLGCQHRYAIAHLIKTTDFSGARRERSIDYHERDIDILLNMADVLVLDNDLETSYHSYLQDAGTLVESHVCSAELLALPGVGSFLDGDSTRDIEYGKPLQVHPHTVRLDDPLLQSLLSLVDRFLGNDIETNLSLTQVMATLASCGYTGLEGWLLSSVVSEKVDPQEQPDLPKFPEQQALAANRDLCASSEDQKPVPQSPVGNADPSNDEVYPMSPVFKSLNALVKQVQRFSQEIEDFDTYLAERRHVFKVGEEIEGALKDTPAPSRRSEDSKATSPSRNRNPPHITSISERLLSGENSAAASRSSSPRGRQRGDQTAPTLVGRLSHLRISPSPSPSKTTSSAQSPSPFRKSSLSSTPPRGFRSPTNPGNALRQTIKIPTNARAEMQHHPHETRSRDGSSVRSESTGPEARDQENVAEISLSHLLTNVIILQEFLLELAAIVEVRASLFGEVSLH